MISRLDLRTSSAENLLYKEKAENLHGHHVRLELYLKRQGYTVYQIRDIIHFLSHSEVTWLFHSCEQG